jgi:hypothetical protein
MALQIQKLTLLVLLDSRQQNEYKRYYPSGEVAANVIGFADIDDNGQEGIELAFDDWLKGTPGRKRVIRDRLGRAFDDVERIRPVEPGKPVTLSIDKRLQYLTYRTLKAAVLKHNAVAGSAVVMNVHTAAYDNDGTNGPTSQILTLITGAAADNGFQGLAGRFARKGLMRFDPHAAGFVFRRADTGAAVRVRYDPSPVPPPAELQALMQRALAPESGAEDRARFARAWRGRVLALLEDAGRRTVQVEPLP